MSRLLTLILASVLLVTAATALHCYQCDTMGLSDPPYTPDCLNPDIVECKVGSEYCIWHRENGKAIAECALANLPLPKPIYCQEYKLADAKTCFCSEDVSVSSCSRCAIMEQLQLCNKPELSSAVIVPANSTSFAHLRASRIV